MSRITLNGPLSAEEAEYARAAIATGDVRGAARLLQEVLDANAKADEFFRLYAPMFGLDPDAAGVEFTSSGKTFRLVGLAINNPKFPILSFEPSTGKDYKHTREAAAVINAAAEKAKVNA